MTDQLWTPENNTTIWALLTDEQKEAMKAAKHGWEYYCFADRGWWAALSPSGRDHMIYRAKPAPKWEPPAELWALLRPDVVAIAKNTRGGWWAFVRPPKMSGSSWVSKGGAYSMEALNLPEIPAAESLFIRPEGE